jgi:signal transduction histidine kinase
VSSVEAAATGRPGRSRGWWAAAVQWRNWPLLVKLGMVLVVPVVGAAVLGVARVRSDVELANSYAEIDRLATLRGELVPVLLNIQRERSLAAQQRAGGSPEFQALTADTDGVIARADRLVGQIPDLGDSARTGYRELTKAFDLLKSLREEIVKGAGGLVVLGGYGQVINTVLEFDRSLVGRFPDEELSGLSAALHDLQSAREQVSLQQAIGLVGLRRGALDPIEMELLVNAGIRLEDRLTDFRAVAPVDVRDRYDTGVTGAEVDRRQALVLTARAGGTIALPFTPVEWNATSNVTTDLMANVARSAAAQLQAVSTKLQESTSNRAGTQSVLLLLMVLLAAGIGGVLGRYLLRSVGLLRRTALDVATNRLPAAVAAIRAGDTNVRIDPVPLRTTEEFGQLARAFDAVHGQAVRSAAEEASLRGNLRNIFVNLSRRSQGLVERQLRLMEQLEQKADDPAALDNLFRLDHLATRMRRNNENLMVLSGMDLGRRSTEPMPLPDVLRAAVSEVEHYQRAVVRSAPMARIVGYAAGDLVRSVAELVENATAFSPPNTQVIITSRRTENGSVLIDILDQGIGMGPAELAQANQRVAAGGGVDVPISRQMGLFVVGSLTRRHGIQVRLSNREATESGLRASVFVPAELVRTDGDTVEPAVAVPAARPARAVGVTGLLESAGIFVRRPELPFATSPASILFAAHTPVAEPAETTEFTWLRAQATGRQPAVAGAVPAPPAAAAAAGPNGLPKRIPQAELLANPKHARRPSPVPSPVSRDAARTRGFLSNFQAGIRQRENNPEGSQ